MVEWQLKQTSLDLASYLQLEDVYTGLCLVRANLYRRRRRKGKPQPIREKICQGGPVVHSYRMAPAVAAYHQQCFMRCRAAPNHMPINTVSRYTMSWLYTACAP